jgi:hypothetical protein
MYADLNMKGATQAKMQDKRNTYDACQSSENPRASPTGHKEAHAGDVRSREDFRRVL